MKIKLLSILALVIMGMNSINAQTKTWDFGNDVATWPVTAGIGVNPMVVDNLGLFPIPTNTNFGAVNANVTTFSDGYVSVNRFQLNGAGFSSGADINMPTQRYLFIDVSRACTVKVWFRTGSNAAPRTMYVSNGTAIVGSETTNTGSNTDSAILTANYTGAAGRLYIYGNAACNLFKVEVSGAAVSTTLSTNYFNLLDKINVYAKNKAIFLDNINLPTEVSIYNLSGALIKNIGTVSSDYNFDLEASTGVYFIKLKAESFQKTVKIILD